MKVNSLMPLLFFVLMMLVASCVPSAADKNGSCPAGFAFDAKTRSCIATALITSPIPMPTFSSVTTLEDVNKLAQLTYTVSKPVPVTSADITIPAGSDFDIMCTSDSSVIASGATGSCPCVAGVCEIEIQPAADISGTKHFTYTLTNDNGTSALQWVDLTITAVDDLPVVDIGATITFLEDDFDFADLTYTDLDGDSATACQVQNLSDSGSIVGLNSCLCVAGVCRATFSGEADANTALFGPIAFDYRVFAGGAWSAWDTSGTVIVTAVNDAPVLAAISGEDYTSTISEGAGASVITLDPVSTTDVESDPITYELVAAPSNGALSGCAAASGDPLVGACTYTATDANFCGSDSFSYKASDGSLYSDDIITESITVDCVNDAPTATDHKAPGPLTLSFAEDSYGTYSYLTFDEGGGSFENSQSITLTITSSAPALLPLTRIQVYLDANSDGAVDAGDTLLGNASAAISLNDGSADISSKRYLLKMTSATNYAGASTVTVTASDGTDTAPVLSILVNVTNVADPATIEAGYATSYTTNENTPIWIGPFKFSEGGLGEEGENISVEITSSDATLIPAANIKIFYDTNDDHMPTSTEYRGDGTTIQSLVDGTDAANLHEVYIKVKPGTNQVGSAELTLKANDTTGTVSFSPKVNITVNPVATLHGGWANIKAVGDKVSFNNLTPQVARYVELKWNAFTMIGSTLTDYKVFKRTTGELYSQTEVACEDDPTTALRVCKDTDVTDETTYFYEVWAVDSNGKLSRPTESVTEVRLYLPPDNLAFVHRWIANKEMCDLLHQTADASQNYSCTYYGPGSVTGDPKTLNYVGSSSGDRFDLGADLIVDQAEMGCPYDTISQVAPSGAASPGTVHYNRSTGDCSVYSVVVPGWHKLSTNPVTNAAITDITAPMWNTFAQKAMKPHLPPLVKLDPLASRYLCDITKGRSAVSSGLNTGGVPMQLPSRVEQVVYSAWDNSTLTDSAMTSLEEGLDLQATSKCNSSSANNYETYFTDTNQPSSLLQFTIAGNQSSAIRSLMTGSNHSDPDFPLTEDCVSRYGIQDAVGNVRELTRDEVVAGGLTASATYVPYGIDDYFKTLSHATVPPTVTAGGLINLVGATIFNWTISDKENSTFYFSPVVGLPVPTASFDLINSTYQQSYLPIGSSSGITSLQLHEDTVDFTTLAANAYFAGGGSYLDGTGAGRWNLKWQSTSSTDTGFRCIARIPHGKYVGDAEHALKHTY